RVRAIGTVWLGQTIGCAQCHDHKFDPIKAADFYAMGAFFADIKEPIIGRREPGILVPSEPEEKELARLDSELKRLRATYDGPHPDLAEPFAQWQSAELERIQNERFWKALEPAELKSAKGAKLEAQEDGSIVVQGKRPDTDTYVARF